MLARPRWSGRNLGRNLERLMILGFLGSARAALASAACRSTASGMSGDKLSLETAQARPGTGSDQGNSSRRR